MSDRGGKGTTGGNSNSGSNNNKDVDSIRDDSRGNSDSRYSDSRGNDDSRYDDSRGDSYYDSRGGDDSRYDDSRGDSYYDSRGGDDSRYDDSRYSDDYDSRDDDSRRSSPSRRSRHKKKDDDHDHDNKSYNSYEEALYSQAARLGMDYELDKDLMWIVEEFLECELPEEWERGVMPDDDEYAGEIFYYNANTEESVWEHPYEQYYREMYETERAKNPLPEEEEVTRGRRRRNKENNDNDDDRTRDSRDDDSRSRYDDDDRSDYTRSDYDDGRSYTNDDGRSYTNDDGRSYTNDDDRSYTNDDDRSYTNDDDRSYTNDDNRSVYSTDNDKDKNRNNNIRNKKKELADEGRRHLEDEDDEFDNDNDEFDNDDEEEEEEEQVVSERESRSKTRKKSKSPTKSDRSYNELPEEEEEFDIEDMSFDVQQSPSPKNNKNVNNKNNNIDSNSKNSKCSSKNYDDEEEEEEDEDYSDNGSIIITPRLSENSIGSQSEGKNNHNKNRNNNKPPKPKHVSGRMSFEESSESMVDDYSDHMVLSNKSTTTKSKSPQRDISSSSSSHPHPHRREQSKPEDFFPAGMSNNNNNNNNNNTILYDDNIEVFEKVDNGSNDLEEDSWAADGGNISRKSSKSSTINKIKTNNNNNNNDNKSPRSEKSMNKSSVSDHHQEEKEHEQEEHEQEEHEQEQEQEQEQEIQELDSFYLNNYEEEDSVVESPKKLSVDNSNKSSSPVVKNSTTTMNYSAESVEENKKLLKKLKALEQEYNDEKEMKALLAKENETLEANLIKMEKEIDDINQEKENAIKQSAIEKEKNKLTKAELDHTMEKLRAMASNMNLEEAEMMWTGRLKELQGKLEIAIQDANDVNENKIKLKQEVEDLKKDKELLQKKKKIFEDKNNDLEEQKETLENKLFELEEYVTQLEEQIHKKEKDDQVKYIDQIGKSKEEKATLQVSLEENQNRIKALVKEVNDLSIRLSNKTKLYQEAVEELTHHKSEVEMYKLEKKAADDALSKASADIIRLNEEMLTVKHEMSERENNIKHQEAELNKLVTERSLGVDRTSVLQMQLTSQKTEHETTLSYLKKQLVDSQNTFNAMKKQMMAAEDDYKERIREAESVKELSEYNSHRAVERCTTAEMWRQRENERAKQAEDILEETRREVLRLKNDLARANGTSEATTTPLRTEILHLEQQLAQEKFIVEQKNRDLEKLKLDHTEDMEKIKQEVATKIPELAQAAVLKAEEEWMNRMQHEISIIRESSDKEIQNAHHNVAEMKKTIIEMQRNLEKQYHDNKSKNESTSVKLQVVEEENKKLSEELKEFQAAAKNSYIGSNTTNNNNSSSSNNNNIQLHDPTALGALEAHLQTLQAQFRLVLEKHEFETNPVTEQLLGNTPQRSHKYNNNNGEEKEQLMHEGSNAANISLTATTPIRKDASFSSIGEIELQMNVSMNSEDDSNDIDASYHYGESYVSIMDGGYHEGYWRTRYQIDDNNNSTNTSSSSLNKSFTSTNGKYGRTYSKFY